MITAPLGCNFRGAGAMQCTSDTTSEPGREMRKVFSLDLKTLTGLLFLTVFKI